MTSIYNFYNIHHVQLPSFKANNGGKSLFVTNPTQQKDVNMNGMEALAAYNYNFIDKNNDFNVSLVNPIKVPDNIDDVDGERIYNSNGDLIEIVKEDDNFKYTYKPGVIPEEKYTLFVTDKKTNKIFKEQREFKYGDYENPSIDVTEFKNNTIIRTAYDSKTLKPTHYDKIINNNNEEISISYDFEHKEFIKDVFDKINIIKKQARYKNNGELIEKLEDKNYSKKYINLKKPTLHPKFKLDYDPKTLDGEKKYYSNGVIEENIVNKNGESVIYHFDTNGNIKEIRKDKLSVYFIDSDNHNIDHTIVETLKDGKEKISVYCKDGATSCSIRDNGKGEQYDFNQNGDIMRHFNYRYEEISDE